MPEWKRTDYLLLRRRYEPEPEKISLVIIAESPPRSGRYFYNPTGAITEPLFSALMRQLGISAISKEDGLQAFQQRGWVLIDATYEPVNALSCLKRDGVIARDYPLLRDDLTSLIPDRASPVVLIKANVCRILEPKLADDGFNVLNRGRIIYFPSSGRQGDFHRQFSAVTGRVGGWP